MKERLKSVLRPLYHSYLSLRYKRRAQQILHDYAAHHREAQQLFASGGNAGTPIISSLADVRVREIAPGGKGNLINLPVNYLNLIERLRRDVHEKFEHSRNCWFFPKLEAQPVPDRTRDIPAVQNGGVIAIQLRDCLTVDGLQELCARLLPELERKVYGSHVIVDKVYIYRNLVSHAEEQVSWTWHYDNHPVEILKIMIYLTDVCEDNGPFEYLRSMQTHQALYMAPAPLSGYGRVSDNAVQQYLSNGYECHKVTGQSGTLLLFDENVVHKANVAKSGYRDVVVLQIRPATFRPETYIDPRWTGSFQHVDFSLTPYEYEPKPKPKMLSG